MMSSWLNTVRFFHQIPSSELPHIFVALAWDQSDKFFKIFISLNNIQKLESEKVLCNFNERWNL